MTSQRDDVMAFFAQTLHQRCADKTGEPSDGNPHMVILRVQRRASLRGPPASQMSTLKNCAGANAESSQRMHRRLRRSFQQ